VDSTLIDKIFEVFASRNPHPSTELKFSNEFTLAVAVILSAQATDIAVNKATRELFIDHNSPEKILALGEEGLKKYIKTIGLYNSKAKNIISLCRILIEKYEGKIPQDFDALITLPGIGRKTANVILNCAFGLPRIAVDTHVFRVSNRIGLAHSSSFDEVEKQLMHNIPPKWRKDAHNWLVLHGRYICKARKPLCEECPINKYCNNRSGAG
jgi:endonuclease-3